MGHSCQYKTILSEQGLSLSREEEWDKNINLVLLLPSCSRASHLMFFPMEVRGTQRQYWSINIPNRLSYWCTSFPRFIQAFQLCLHFSLISALSHQPEQSLFPRSALSLLLRKIHFRVLHFQFLHRLSALRIFSEYFFALCIFLQTHSFLIKTTRFILWSSNWLSTMKIRVDNSLF